MPSWVLQVPSSGRPQHVPRLQQLLDMEAVWYVPADQAGDYRYAGARLVVPVEHDGWEGRLAVQRNRMLEDAFTDGAASVQVDDDLRSVKWYEGEGRPVHLPFREAVRRVLDAMAEHGALLGGCATTANPLNYRRPLTLHGLVRSLLVLAPSDLRFDERCTTKMDYDLVLQHLHAVGCVARLDGLLMEFPYRKGKAGCEEYRTQEVLEAGAAYLLAKWPDAVAPNAKKPGELRLVWKPPA